MYTKFSHEEKEPQSYEEAMTSPERKHWVKAMEDEITLLNKTKTWYLIQAPQKCNTNRAKMDLQNKKG